MTTTAPAPPPNITPISQNVRPQPRTAPAKHRPPPTFACQPSAPQPPHRMDPTPRPRRLLPALIVACATLVHLHGADRSETKLELNKGDHVAIIGSGFADRMQHDGWLEALVYRANPGLDLTFRNLAFSCDEVVTRERTDTGATLAFCGYSEPFAGAGGLPRFRQELDGFIKAAQKANYNGRGAPRLVLFSPIAQEKLAAPTLQDPTANNQNPAAYTTAMAAVAKADQVPFVDLFSASQKLYAEARQPLTFNCI